MCAGALATAECARQAASLECERLRKIASVSLSPDAVSGTADSSVLAELRTKLAFTEDMLRHARAACSSLVTDLNRVTRERDTALARASGIEAAAAPAADACQHQQMA